MKKILFPTDFSETANHAFVYALNIAKKLSAEITTLHVYKLPDVKARHLPHTLQEIYNSVDLEAFQNYKDTVPVLRKIAEENHLSDVHFTNSLVLGETIPVILKTAKNTAADMIIMGTKGAGWLKEIFIGSVAGEVMEHADCPVLAIPEGAKFDGNIDKIGLAIECTDEDYRALFKVLEWSHNFNAGVYCLHVDSSHTESITHKMEKFREKVGHHKNLNFVNLNDFDIEKSIINYVEKEGIDVVAMLTHKRNFFQELFNYSLAKKMSYHTKIPILAIQARTLEA